MAFDINKIKIVGAESFRAKSEKQHQQAVNIQHERSRVIRGSDESQQCKNGDCIDCRADWCLCSCHKEG